MKIKTGAEIVEDFANQFIQHGMNTAMPGYKTLAEMIDENIAQSGPDTEDGYAHEGFHGGCIRMGCPDALKAAERIAQLEAELISGAMDRLPLVKEN
jgi:hypothetical protein